MAWDTGLDLEGARERAALLPSGKHLCEITKAELGEKIEHGKPIGARVAFTFRSIEGPNKGAVVTLAPYIPGKDFKGKETQAQWGKDMWANIIRSCGVDPKKVQGKKAMDIANKLVGQVVVVEVEVSLAKETEAEAAARAYTGAEPKMFTNVRSTAHRSTWNGAGAAQAAELPIDDEEDAGAEVVNMPQAKVEAAADADFSLEDMG